MNPKIEAAQKKVDDAKNELYMAWKNNNSHETDNYSDAECAAHQKLSEAEFELDCLERNNY